MGERQQPLVVGQDSLGPGHGTEAEPAPSGSAAAHGDLSEPRDGSPEPPPTRTPVARGGECVRPGRDGGQLDSTCPVQRGQLPVPCRNAAQCGRIALLFKRNRNLILN